MKITIKDSYDAGVVQYILGKNGYAVETQSPPWFAPVEAYSVDQKPIKMPGVVLIIKEKEEDKNDNSI